MRLGERITDSDGEAWEVKRISPNGDKAMLRLAYTPIDPGQFWLKDGKAYSVSYASRDVVVLSEGGEREFATTPDYLRKAYTLEHPLPRVWDRHIHIGMKELWFVRSVNLIDKTATLSSPASSRDWTVSFAELRKDFRRAP